MVSYSAHWDTTLAVGADYLDDEGPGEAPWVA